MLSEPVNTAGQAGREPWLLCRAASRLCGIPLGHVVEVMRVLPIEAVQSAPGYVRGLSIIRGRPVVVVDTGLLIAGQPTVLGRLVAVRTGSRMIALVAEAVLGTRAVASEIFNQFPPLLRNAADDTIVAIGTVDAELLFVLHTARLVPEELLHRIDGARAVA